MNPASYRLLDTDVASYIWGNRVEASTFRPLLTGCIGTLSFITVGELLKGAYLKNWGAERISAMREHIRANYLVLPYTHQVVEHWARLVSSCTKSGFTPGSNDAWIAATAVAYECPVVANDKGFREMSKYYPELHVLP